MVQQATEQIGGGVLSEVKPKEENKNELLQIFANTQKRIEAGETAAFIVCELRKEGASTITHAGDVLNIEKVGHLVMAAIGIAIDSFDS